jgi:putative transposase
LLLGLGGPINKRRDNHMSFESLSHSKWDCKYHVVFVPKYRKKVLYGKIRKFLGPVFHELAGQRRSKILEGYMVQDHMLIQIPPKYAGVRSHWLPEGEGAIAVARQFSGRKKNFNGESFWARGYAVSTVGFEEAQIRGYIQNQEQLNRQHNLFAVNARNLKHRFFFSAL